MFGQLVVLLRLPGKRGARLLELRGRGIAFLFQLLDMTAEVGLVLLEFLLFLGGPGLAGFELLLHGVELFLQFVGSRPGFFLQGNKLLPGARPGRGLTSRKVGLSS